MKELGTRRAHKRKYKGTKQNQREPQKKIEFTIESVHAQYNFHIHECLLANDAQQPVAVICDGTPCKFRGTL